MSMISGLIDELNKSADEWNGSNMFELARMCRSAADTIWQLRDDLQRANTENAKLREEVVDLRKSSQTYESENAKLRELVDYMTPIALYGASEQERDRMRELGVDA